jgi:hypothetical protein
MMLCYTTKRHEVVGKVECRNCVLREMSEVGGLQAAGRRVEEARVSPLGLLG